MYNTIRKVANAMPKSHKFWIFFVRMPNFRAIEECIRLVCNGIYPLCKYQKNEIFSFNLFFAVRNPMTVGNVPPPFSIYVFRPFIYNKYDCFGHSSI